MGKVTKKIMNIGFLLALYFVCPLFAYSQVTYDLNGTFEGRHIEFTTDGSNDSLSYFYKFELSQDGQKVRGKSYIYNEDGYYAVVQVKGLILENQLYFEEYQTIDEINPKENQWCYTSGHLDIIKEGGSISLRGYTKSYTKQYGALCRIGFSDVAKIDSQNEATSSNIQVEPTVSNLMVNPNPTEAQTSINFYLSIPEMTIIEVYDLEGELILEVLRRDLMKGSHSFPIDLSFKPDGMYIVELIIDRKLYTTELWKSRL